MWSVFRNSISRAAEGLLRWLTASALRSTAIFVILTFVPILLLTYYIVATSIGASKADAANTDRQARDFAVSLLRADFRGEREALVGVADEMSLQRALNAAGATTHRADLDRTQAATTLAHLLRRRTEFAFVALYDKDGVLQAVAPANANAAASLTEPRAGGAILPPWFEAALRGQTAISPLQPAAPDLPARLEFAVAVSAEPAPAAPPSGPPAAGPGVLVGALPAAVATDWLRHINLGEDRFAYLVDASRSLVSAPAAAPVAPDQVPVLPAVAEALAGKSGSGQFLTLHLESIDVSYAPLPQERLALLLMHPVRFGFYIFRLFYDKLALIAVIIFLLAVATGLLLRAAFRYYQRYNREVESGRAKTEALLSSIGDGVFAVDPAGVIIEFNRAAAALARLPAPAVLRRLYPEVIQFADERTGARVADTPADPVRQAMNQRRTLRYLRDFQLLRRDAPPLPVTVGAAPVLGDRGEVEGCVVVFSDASHEREVDRLKNEFISIASHQLRTPMSGVKGVLALLLEDVLGPLNREQRDYLRRAYDSNERLIALVNDLLNISRLEQGSLQLRQEPVNLADVLRALVAEFQPRAARYRQTLELSGGFDPARALLRGDPVRLREVFANLLDNAVKYTPEGGQIRVSIDPSPELVSVEVSDTGVGIPADKMQDLFQKFNRIQNPLSGREFGTGLGLYFARSVVELHQGTIEVSSQPGAGTVFRVRLPRSAAPPARA